MLIDENVVGETEEGVVLFGGANKTTGEIVFPMPVGPDAALYDRIPLKSEGTLWSYTVQRFAPKSPPYLGPTDPEGFKPFALGYVELAGQVIVESRIAIDDLASLRVGLPMKLTSIPFASNAQGHVLRTYAFEPVSGGD